MAKGLHVEIVTGRVERTLPGTTHVLATCRNCQQSWDDYKTADADARRHVEQTGHTVSVEHAQAWTYSARKD